MAAKFEILSLYSTIRGSIVDAFRSMLDGFSKNQWKVQGNKSAMYDVSDTLVTNFDGAKILRPWKDDEVPNIAGNHDNLFTFHRADTIICVRSVKLDELSWLVETFLGKDV